MMQLDLQRFAESMDGGAQGTGSGGPAAAVDPAAGGNAGSENQGAFDQLIQGQYKQDFENAVGQRVQAAIQQRFKNQQDLQKRIDGYSPIMQALGAKYGRDPGDVEGIAKLLTDDDSLYADEANRMGLPVETVKTMKRLEADNARLKAMEQRTAEDEALRMHFQRVSQQAEELKQTFPGFDLMQEMQNPRFARMTGPEIGMSVKDAFYAIHGEEIQRQSMQYAAQQAGQRLAASVRAGASRPMENGMQRGAPANLAVDVKGMDKKTRDEYRRRIKNGEIINFRDKV